MFRTIKSKFSVIYIGLVIIIAVIGLFSSITNYRLGKQINGLMVRNYKSIKAVTNMHQVIEDQNSAVLTYISIDEQEGLHSYLIDRASFNEFFSVEANNVTEPGEGNLVSDLKIKYKKYDELFTNLQNVKNTGNVKQAINYYNNNMLTEFTSIKNILNQISLLNEKGMFNSKDRVTMSARQSMYIILVLSLTLVVIGFFTSRLSINKFLQPLYSLRETIKSVHEGDLNRQAPVLSMDEIGDLTTEFNSMTRRLLQFEKSTLGKLMSEKTKSVTIVKSIPDPLIVLDTHYKIILLNDACEDIFNIKEDNVLYSYFSDTINNPELYQYITSIGNSYDENKEQKIIYLNIDGKDYYYNIIANTLRDSLNNISGLVILFQNVTQLKQLEKLKSDFISTISHEFKTPLTSIMIGTSLFSNEKIGTLNTKQLEIVAAITEDSERLLALVNDLLNLNKMESSKAVFDIKPYSILGIIDTSVKAFSEQAKNREVYLHYELEDKLPKVSTDFEKSTWILNNLISNALKYTSTGDEILVNAFVKYNKMCISVKDTGVGIPKEYQEKIFEKFIQVAGQDFESKGTGLGLAMSKEIVEALGGEIWCESELDIGSTFIFTLPLTRLDEGEF